MIETPPIVMGRIELPPTPVRSAELQRLSRENAKLRGRLRETETELAAVRAQLQLQTDNIRLMRDEILEAIRAARGGRVTQAAPEKRSAVA